MTEMSALDGLEVGFDVPALPGMSAADIQTPCLILDGNVSILCWRRSGDD